MARLPLVACFHGGGSNATVMSMQCSRLQHLLKSTFEFVYFDAPFPRSAGPGVLPGFKNYGSFKTWFKIDEDGHEMSDGSGYDYYENGGIERVLKMMLAEGEAHEWVGALGFSQGTRIAGGLLLDQQKRKEAGEKNVLALKFGVLCMGGAAPMSSNALHGLFNKIGVVTKCNTDAIIDSFNERYGIAVTPEISKVQELVTIPTLHLHGLRDMNLNNGRKQLATFYDQDTTRLLEINYHHALPWERSDNAEFADMILELYNDTQ